jgi:hypothetical protein
MVSSSAPARIWVLSSMCPSVSPSVGQKRPSGEGRPLRQSVTLERARCPGSSLRFRTIERAGYRVEQHALRSAERPYGLKASLPNPVVDGSPRNPQKRRRMVKRNAATDAMCHPQVGFLLQRRHPVCVRMPIRNARTVPACAGACTDWSTRSGTTTWRFNPRIASNRPVRLLPAKNLTGG